MGADGTRIRPMTPDDTAAVHGVMVRSFADLVARIGRPPDPPAPEGPSHARIRHLIATDPGGAFVAEREDEVFGAALALVREGVWGLSLLVLEPGTQSGGVGTRLLGEAVAYGAGARGGLILASEDPRALRAYARAGFDLHPALEAAGVPGPLEAPSHVREGGAEDLPLAAAVDRHVRGATHGSDLEVVLDAGARMLVVPDRGYALVSGGSVRAVAAYDEPAAADLLRAAIASTPEGATATVNWITSAQQGWALPVLLDGRLELRFGGAVFTRGDVGPFAPYLPTGAYL